MEEKAKGECNLTLPMLRPQFETKYSMAHLVDLSKDESNWNNNIYKDVYGIVELTVLSWDEWEETVKK